MDLPEVTSEFKKHALKVDVDVAADDGDDERELL